MENVGFSLFGVSFEKSDWNQTWVKDAMGVPFYAKRSKVMYQGQGTPEVKSGGKCKIGIIFLKL